MQGVVVNHLGYVHVSRMFMEEDNLRLFEVVAAQILDILFQAVSGGSVVPEDVLIFPARQIVLQYFLQFWDVGHSAGEKNEWIFSIGMILFF